MMNQPPELFSQPPVRSSYYRRPQKRRQLSRAGYVVVILALLGLAGGAGYGLYDVLFAGSTGEIPTVKSALPVKQKPDQPGGIDIPHQDVAVFQQLNKNDEDKTPKPVEHLLPPAAAPSALTSAVTPTQDQQAPMQATPPAVSGVENLAPPENMPTSAHQQPAPLSESEKTALVEKPSAPQEALVPTAVSAAPLPQSAPLPAVTPGPAPVPPPASKEPAPKETAVKEPAPKAKAMASPNAAPARAESLPREIFSGDSEQKIKSLSRKNATAAGGKGAYAIQLASLPSQDAANALLQKYQMRYASALQGHALRIVRANVEGRGTYYRIQSQPTLSDQAARDLCMTIKGMGGSCIPAKH